jgi:UDP-3-O-[3-hydroxymyristoyl] glucosamine N-acyltransferase
MKLVPIDDLKVFESFGAKIFNERNFIGVSNVASIKDANEHSLIFIDTNTKNIKSLISSTKANVIICNFETYTDCEILSKCFIVAENPKLLFAKSISFILKEIDPAYIGIHPTTTVHRNTRVPENVFIGANCSIGHCKIGEGTIIHPGCHIYDGVIIGKNVIIDSGAVIGSAGFGFVRDEKGVPYRFPQLGGVIIEDDVEIGANTCIDRGALENTIIHKGVKIDNLVQIAHNVEIGKYTYIIGQTVVAGSTKIGERCWIASSFIINKIKIGNDVTIGFGSVVLKSVPSGATYMGDPAISLENYSILQYKLKKIYNHGN